MAEEKKAEFPEIKSEKSLVKKYLTKEIYDKLKDKKTKTSGFTLDQCIICAVKFDNQHVGMYAGDEDCYSDYADLFNPVIKEYHNVNIDECKHTSDLNPDNLKDKKIDNPDYIVSTRIRVGRNIKGLGLSPGITTEQREEVEKLMKGAFDSFKGTELEGQYYSLETMKEEDRKDLVDKHFLFMSGDPNLIASGMERDWPKSRGIFLNKDNTFLVWVNEEDQLRIISMRKGGDVNAVFKLLMDGIAKIENYLKEKGKEFLKTDQLGFITSCPTNLGTGMRASVHMDLGALKKKLGGSDQLKEYCKKMKLQARGTRGESGGDTGDVYDISNRHRLGYSEVELVTTMIDGVNKLYAENEAAKEKK